MAINIPGKQRGTNIDMQYGALKWDLKLLRGTGDDEVNSGSESFQPEYHQIKKLGLKPNRKKLRTGGWSAFENQLYLRFMLKHLQDFRSERERRRSKVFYRLSKILKRRTPDQCRSHHQKLQLKHGDNFTAIIREVQRKIQTSIVHQMLAAQERPPMYPSHLPLHPLERPEFKTVVDEGWFSIESWRACLKISIDCKSISQW